MTISPHRSKITILTYPSRGESLELQPQVFARNLASTTSLLVESYISSTDTDSAASETWQDALKLDIVVISPIVRGVSPCVLVTQLLTLFAPL